MQLAFDVGFKMFFQFSQSLRPCSPHTQAPAEGAQHFAKQLFLLHVHDLTFNLFVDGKSSETLFFSDVTMTNGFGDVSVGEKAFKKLFGAR